MWHFGLRLAAGGFVSLGIALGSAQALPQQGTQGSVGNGDVPVVGVQGPIAGPAVGTPAGITQPANGNLPRPFEPLTEDHQKYLFDLLTYWENSTQQIERFRCKFNRWDYDPIWGPKPDPKTGEMQAMYIATGEIKYEVPDKAMYEVTGMWEFQAGNANEGTKSEFVEVSNEAFDKWITDGKASFQYDVATKQVRRIPIPPEMQGKTIADGPIPFIFGAKADKMKSRYWIRVITPTEAQKAGEYWLEAYPKTTQDAQEFSRVKVILDKQFLPKAVEIYATDYDEIRNRKSQTYVFEERKINESNLSLFKILDRPFYQPSIPSGWQMVDVNLNQPGVASGGPDAPAGQGVNLNR